MHQAKLTRIVENYRSYIISEKRKPEKIRIISPIFLILSYYYHYFLFIKELAEYLKKENYYLNTSL